MKQENRILFVGGTFNNEGGKQSKVVDAFAKTLGPNVTLYNGGYYRNLDDIVETTTDYDTVFWWANVPNDLLKIRNVKDINPKCLLITSKRNDNNKYNFGELITRALNNKANLIVEFSKKLDKFEMRVFDPLGVVYYEGLDIGQAAQRCQERLDFLKTIKRQGTRKSTQETTSFNPEPKFLELVKEYAEVFHECINPAPEVKRFLGNTSFRCQRGFPSYRTENEDCIMVSRRNIDKRFIDNNGFVEVYLQDKDIYYKGEYKPSVDAPIQINLYKQLPEINYMLHAHCYIIDAPFTTKAIPCGALDEIDEILCVYDKDKETNYINLIGHGSLVMCRSLEGLFNIPYMPRPLPEKLEI